MENKLEQLLNSLIEKGYIPFNIPCITNVSFLRRLWITSHQNDRDYKFDFSLRDLVSKESWLWQFVCENGMIKKEHRHERILDPTFWEWWADCKRQEHDWNCWYRLIESALCDEDKLEEFLLSNIKVDE